MSCYHSVLMTEEGEKALLQTDREIDVVVFFVFFFFAEECALDGDNYFLRLRS